MCQWPWRHPQQSFCCCASEHMIFSSENKCFCNIGARLYFVDLSFLFKEPACENQIFKGWQFFSDSLSLTAMALSYTQSGKNNLWEIFFRHFLSTGRRAVNWHIFLCKNKLWLPLTAFPDLHACFIDRCFLLFLFSHKCPFYTCLSLPRPVPGTTGWHKYLWICILLNGFTVGMLITKFSHVSFSCTYLGSSICLVVS